jgi:hypothetical protein
MIRNLLTSKREVVIDRYCHSVVASSGITRKNPEPGKRKRYYNRKSPRTIKKLTQLINLFYENRQKQNYRIYWATITTLQHKTLQTDRELYYNFKLWQQHRNERYICIAERQRDTGDLHFHLITERKSDYNFKEEVKRLAGYFGVESHPALFDVSRIYNVKTLVCYIAKYVRKPLPSYLRMCEQYAAEEQAAIAEGRKPKHKAYYSSLFQCRTFSVSGDLSKQYKEKHYSFRIAVSRQFIQFAGHLLRVKYQTDFFTVYEYDVKIWQMAQEFKSHVLKKIPDPAVAVVLN